MLILTVNTGSSSLKLRIVDDDDEAVAEAEVDSWDGEDTAAVAGVLEGVDGVDAVGHRVVHGGTRFAGPTRLDTAALDAVAALAGLAPLHQPRSLAGIAATRRLIPGVPAVACFDTAFHASLPAAASTYALPSAWRALGIRRFGFHGLSHAWAASRAAQLIGRPLGDLRLVIAHLGAGASLCAVAGGRSVDTTMGFTPLEGLVMATRSGSVDPGALLWLQQEHGFDAAEIADGLEHRSGLAGLTGGTGDLRRVIADADAGENDARVGYAVYLHRLRASIAAMAASLGGLDGLVFTGGVGENSGRVRSDACLGLGFLGLPTVLAEPPASVDAVVAGGDDDAAVVVVTAREDLQIAAEVRQVLAAP